MNGARCIELGKRFLQPAAGLEREYVRLFLSPDGAPCPPWQSVYGTGRRLLGPEHHSARAWFRRYGVEPVTGSEPADHVGLLLLFYGQLAQAGVDERELALFRKQHLDWIVPFCERMWQSANEDDYRRLARDTAETINLLNRPAPYVPALSESAAHPADRHRPDAP